MKKVVLEIISFAIAIALIVGVILVISNQAHTTGNNAKEKFDRVDSTIDSLSTEVN